MRREPAAFSQASAGAAAANRVPVPWEFAIEWGVELGRAVLGAYLGPGRDTGYWVTGEVTRRRRVREIGYACPAAFAFSDTRS